MATRLRFYIMVLIATGMMISGCGNPQSQDNNIQNETSSDSQIITGNVTFPSASNLEPEWQEDFDLAGCTLSSEGRNDFFILEPGFQLVLEGGNEKLAITVLDKTIEIDGTMTRVVEEREWRNDEIIEISYNFFAFCKETKDVFYFGEDVDMFSGGVLSSHSGAWRAGVNDARAGLIMPGDPVVGMKYFQEIAPGVAMDRAEVISLDKSLNTPAGEFTNVLVTKEGTALNLLEQEFKTYASGIGLIQDQNLLLTEYGFVELE
ncbi:MAG: hypothetical protein JSV69_02480 [Chloroflexota bacterium]|nr:MAG: hypothetical protein JSV69_02480 [Chloroflexota bacterium]